LGLVLVAHAGNPSCSGNRDQEDPDSRSARETKGETPSQKYSTQ
jgi:hypothetical protein